MERKQTEGISGIRLVFELETVIMHFSAVSSVSATAIFQMLSPETKKTASFSVTVSTRGAAVLLPPPQDTLP